MQETKTNPLNIRITDSELQRLEAIRGRLGLPSMTNTALGHDLLVIGMEQMETRTKATRGEGGGKRQDTGKRVPGKPNRKEARV
jgi:hypothetical protein